MPALIYQIRVESPCPGDQIVNMVATNHYTGSGGTFTYAVLSRSPVQPKWRITIYDYTQVGPCTPTKDFEQVQASDTPVGVYEGTDPTDQAVVADFP